MPIQKRNAYRPRNERLRLTKSAIDRMVAGSKDYLVKDLEIPQLNLKVTPAGKKSFLVRYRNDAGTEQKFKIGDYPTLNVTIARKRAAEVLQAKTLGQDPAADRRAVRKGDTLLEFGRSFLEGQIGQLRPKTLYDYGLLLENVLGPVLGNRKLASIVRSDAQRLHDRLSHTPYQANRAAALLSRIFSYAEDLEAVRLGSNPTRLVRKYKEKQRETILSNAETIRVGKAMRELMAANPQSAPAYQAVQFLFLTGCRVGEALKLRWEDIDLDRSILVFREGKTGTRKHPMSSKLTEMIISLPSRDSSPWVFPSRDPSKQRVDLKKTWANICMRAEIENVRLHDIRHTVLTDLAAVTDIKTVALIAGHKSTDTTNRYLHEREERTQKAMERAAGSMDSLLSGTAQNEEEI